MTPEERAKISRENGAKSRGPKTEEGKATSSRNAIKSGDYADDLKHFIPPHEACVCTEDRDVYEALVADFVAIYKPVNRAARLAVGDIAAATWQVERLKKVITMTWNLALTTSAARPTDLPVELGDIKMMVDSTADILAGNSVLAKLNREVARLQQSIARAERRIRFIHKNFPDAAPQDVPEQTWPESDPSVENKPLKNEVPEIMQNLPAPVYTTESSPKVIKGYQRDFPGRPIVILPAGPNGPDSDEDDDYRDLPRKVA